MIQRYCDLCKCYIGDGNGHSFRSWAGKELCGVCYEYANMFDPLLEKELERMWKTTDFLPVDSEMRMAAIEYGLKLLDEGKVPDQPSIDLLSKLGMVDSGGRMTVTGKCQLKYFKSMDKTWTKFAKKWGRILSEEDTTIKSKNLCNTCGSEIFPGNENYIQNILMNEKGEKVGTALTNTRTFCDDCIQYDLLAPVTDAEHEKISLLHCGRKRINIKTALKRVVDGSVLLKSEHAILEGLHLITDSGQLTNRGRRQLYWYWWGDDSLAEDHEDTTMQYGPVTDEEIDNLWRTTTLDDHSWRANQRILVKAALAKAARNEEISKDEYDVLRTLKLITKDRELTGRGRFQLRKWRLNC